MSQWGLQGYRAKPFTEASLGTGERMPPDDLVARLRAIGSELCVC